MCQAARSSHCSSAGWGHTTTRGSSALTVQLLHLRCLDIRGEALDRFYSSLDGVIRVFAQPLSSVVVPVPPEKKPSVQFRSNSSDKLNTGSSKHDNCFVSRHGPVCHVSCESCIVWVDASFIDSSVCFCFWSCYYQHPIFPLHRQNIAWNEICACAWQRLCDLQHLHSRNVSTPPNSNRRMRHATAAVVPLPSVSQGAVMQKEEGRKTKSHLTWLPERPGRFTATSLHDR